MTDRSAHELLQPSCQPGRLLEAGLQRLPPLTAQRQRRLDPLCQFHCESSPSAFTRTSYRMRCTSEEAGTRFRGRGLGSRRRLYSCQGSATLTRSNTGLAAFGCSLSTSDSAIIRASLRTRNQISQIGKKFINETDESLVSRSLQRQASAFFLRKLGVFGTSTRHSNARAWSAA